MNYNKLLDWLRKNYKEDNTIVNTSIHPSLKGSYFCEINGMIYVLYVGDLYFIIMLVTEEMIKITKKVYNSNAEQYVFDYEDFSQAINLYNSFTGEKMKIS